MHRNGFRNVLIELEKADIRYVLLRKDLLLNTPIKDLDLLIDASQYSDFRRVAQANGFFLIKDGFLNPAKKVFIRPCHQSSLLIDLHLEVVHRGLVFHDANACLQRRQKQDGLFYLSDEDYLISLLFHNLLAKKRIQEKHADELRRLFKKPLDEKYLREKLQQFCIWPVFVTIRQEFEDCVRNPQRVEPLATQAKQLLKKSVPGNRRRLWQVRWRRYRLRVFGRKRGVLVAFMGPDGSGKTTTIHAVRDYLKAVGCNTRVVYLGPWGGSLFHFKERLKRLNVDPYREDYKAYYAGKLSTKPGPLPFFKRMKLFVRSAIYYPLLMIEMAARWQLRVLPGLREGRIVLADRYIYDMLVGYKNRPMDYHVRLRRLLCRLYPRPDFGVLLDADPEIIFKRKPQLRTGHLAMLRPIYHQVARQYGFVVLDTGTSVDATVQGFAETLLTSLLKRLQTRLD